MADTPIPDSGLSGWRAAAFGARRGALRVFAVFAGFAALLAWAEWRWEAPGRDIVHCFRRPARHHGAQVWLGPARVTAVLDDGFVSREALEDLVRVKAPSGLVREGDQVVLRGTFHRDGYLVLDERDGRPVLRFSPSGQEKRVWMFVLSFGALGYVAWRARRAFRVRGWRIERRPADGTNN